MKTLREFLPTDRYFFDSGMCSINKGFAQIDTEQDAPYYGMWANPCTLVVFTYAEGDWITRTAETEQEFINEIRGVVAWSISSGLKFHGIDPGFNKKLKSRFEKLGLSDLLH